MSAVGDARKRTEDQRAAEIRAAKAEALREAAEELETTDNAVETALQGIDYPVAWLRERADWIEAES